MLNMVTKIRINTENPVSQAKSAQSLKSAGGEKMQKTVIPKGIAAANIKGCRRPQRERQRSEIAPMSGSVTASKIRLAVTAKPVKVPGRPNTWL